MSSQHRRRNAVVALVCIVVLAACAAAFCAFGAAPAAADVSLNWYGEVVDVATNEPIPGVIVRIVVVYWSDSWSDYVEEVVAGCRTSSTGTFELHYWEPPGHSLEWDWHVRLEVVDPSGVYLTGWGPGSTTVGDKTPWESHCSYWSSIKLVKDTHTPIRIYSRPRDVTESTSATFVFSTATPGSEFECRLDSGDWGECTSPCSYAELAQGSHRWEIRQKGEVGAPSVVVTWTVVRYPETTITSGPQGSVPSASAAFTFSADKPGCRFECKYDDRGWKSATSPLTLTVLGEGTHSFTVRAIDADGLADPSPAVRTWTIAHPPETTLNSGPPAVTQSDCAFFALSAAHPGSTYEWRLDGGAWQARSPRTDYAVGDYTRLLAASDLNGDGMQDLVTTVRHDWVTYLGVLLGDGSGGFEPMTRFGAISNYSDRPRSIALGDFNGDGVTDVVAANGFEFGVRILLGDGTGGFGEAVLWSTAGQPDVVAVGDFDGDGNPDIAAADHDDDILDDDIVRYRPREPPRTCQQQRGEHRDVQRE